MAQEQETTLGKPDAVSDGELLTFQRGELWPNRSSSTGDKARS